MKHYELLPKALAYKDDKDVHPNRIVKEYHSYKYYLSNQVNCLDLKQNQHLKQHLN